MLRTALIALLVVLAAAQYTSAASAAGKPDDFRTQALWGVGTSATARGFFLTKLPRPPIDNSATGNLATQEPSSANASQTTVVYKGGKLVYKEVRR